MLDSPPGATAQPTTTSIDPETAPASPVKDLTPAAPSSPDEPAAPVTPETAIAAARRDRFPNLCSTGILGTRYTGQPINPDHVATALAFLGRCRRTKRPNFHTYDLQRHIGVGVGAIIAAGVGLGFEVRGLYGGRMFYPHALMGVNKSDVGKLSGRVIV
jgi:hypothetical protein